MESMLEVKGLSVEIAGKLILKDINLVIKKNNPTVLFGPNGSGKSTLIKAIMGIEGFNIVNGEIIFKGEKLNGLRIQERVKLGLGMMFQHPPKIRGVKLAQLANFLSKDQKLVDSLAEELSLKEHLNRDVNLGFSGGEMKRSELFQVLLQESDLIFLDEPESGVDLENIGIMGKALNEYLKKPGKSALLITHTGYILDYVKAKNGCMMIDGKLWCVGEPKEMFESIRKHGYEKCQECECPQGS
jgi:Fe-S cluster assembly ATP-binding protein